jgi:alkylated DNA repair dioxygenase AlkB
VVDLVGATTVSTTLGPGTVRLPGWLNLDEQTGLVGMCAALMDGMTPGYVPVVRGGGRMHVRMLCLGRHWNGQRYRYEATRSDFDHRAAPPIPPDWCEMARRAAGAAATSPHTVSGCHDAASCSECAMRASWLSFDPDICILNFYPPDGRMGLHQDKDETPASIAAGLPVVSISLGETARFLWGGLKRRDAVTALPLMSGDAFVFGGPARLRYHGVSRITPGTAPPVLGLSGRFNLTFRRY